LAPFSPLIHSDPVIFGDFQSSSDSPAGRGAAQFDAEANRFEAAPSGYISR